MSTSNSTNDSCPAAEFSFVTPATLSGPRSGGQEEGGAGEDQEPEEEIQTENPGEHPETETRAAEKETDEEEAKSRAVDGVNHPHVYILHSLYNTCNICFTCK